MAAAAAADALAAYFLDEDLARLPSYSKPASRQAMRRKHRSDPRRVTPYGAARFPSPPLQRTRL
jgi:hypothetical protein